MLLETFLPIVVLEVDDKKIDSIGSMKYEHGI